MTDSEKRVDRDGPGEKGRTETATKAKPGDAAEASRPEHMTEDGKSLEAGSGNTLGDGMTAGGANRIQERRKLQD